MTTIDDVTSARALLAAPLRLPCGAVLPNRLCKAAMGEGLADRQGGPSEALIRLYARWAQGGAGLLITGNVMVDANARGELRDVVLEDDRHMPALRRWAEASTRHGVPIWMQINHPGRQSMSPNPVAPSAVPMKKGQGVFLAPRALQDDEIRAIIRRFARTSALAQEAGFSGVQIHGAHGYLISQFLSPLTNQRTDEWGGSPENRRRFLLEIVRAMREAVGPAFPIGVKLNSADFQRGGFSEEDSLAVVQALDAAGVDLLEVSGGTYESAAMTGLAPAAHMTKEVAQKASTRQREAYFLDYAERVRQAVTLPLIVTGGFRTVAGMGAALAGGGADVIGLARPLAQEPDLPAQLLAGTVDRSQVTINRTGIPDLDSLLQILWYQDQLQRIGHGHTPDPRRSPWLVLAGKFLELGPEMFIRRRG
jgi:2,4-dienoyl-CoA reductase-like NADH-dependent reductase (Old Yellow Enzyme family)